MLVGTDDMSRVHGPPPGPTLSEYNTVLRENARLVAQVRKLQDLVATMREEIADANSEVAALNRLHDEQLALTNETVVRERTLREQLQAHIAERASIRFASVGTNTVSEVSTSTQNDAATGTVSSGTSTSTDIVVAARPGPAAVKARPTASYPSLSVAPRVEGYPPPRVQYRSPPRGVRNPANTELYQFGDWLSRVSGYRPMDESKELGTLFDGWMGATSVGEVCATVNERDLTDFGVPVAKARSIMHHVLEHAAYLLSHT